jgi:TPP-dependent trihydroxycyclohexane-1,2-dione (THcHDO) dehydratase
LDRGQIYHWKVQLAERTRHAEIEEIADSQGVSLDQARQIRELQEELAATQQKLAQTILECDLLKKIRPNSQFTKKSSSYIETKQLLARFKGRAK